MHSMIKSRGGLFWAALLFGGSFALYLLYSTHPLWNCEAMYAEVPREMLQSRDFLYPTLNYAPFIFKPPLFFWANTLAMWLFGQTWGPRIPEALFAAGTVLFVFKTAARSSHLAGIMAAVATATCMGFVIHTAELLPDVPMGFFTAAAVYYFLRISDGETGAIGLYLSLGLAVMTKGFLGLVFPGIAFIVFIAAERRLELLKRLISVPGIIVFLAITVPWHILMEIRNPGFLHDYVINEQVLRFFNKRYPPDWDSLNSPTFFLVTLGWMMPWAAFLFQGAATAVKKRDKTLRMALCWGAGGMAFLLLSSQKMEYYQIPLFPPLAILAGGYLAALAEGRETDGKKAAAGGALALALFGVLSAAAAPRILGRFSGGLTARESEALLLSAEVCLCAVAAGGLAAYFLMRWNAYGTAFAAIALSALALAGGSRQALDALLPELSDVQAAKAAARLLKPEDVLVVQAREEYEYSATFCYYTGKKVLILKDDINPMVPSAFKNRAVFVISSDGLRRIWNAGNRVFFVYRDIPDGLAGLIPKGLGTRGQEASALICNKLTGVNISF